MAENEETEPLEPRGGFYAEPETFHSVLRHMPELRSSGSLHLLVVGGQLSFSIEDDDPEPLFGVLNEVGVSLSELRAVLLDLGDILQSLLLDAPDEAFVAVRGNPDRFGNGSMEESDVALAKRRSTERRFDLDLLRERLWLRRRASTPFLSFADWEILVPTGGSGAAPPRTTPPRYAVLKLATEKVSPLPSGYEPPNDLPDSWFVSLTAEEIDYLSAVLSRLRSNMTQASLPLEEAPE